MFRINIITIGRNKDEWVDDAVNHYLKLLSKYADVSFEYIQLKRLSKNISPGEQKKIEAEVIRQKIKSRYQIALSDKGNIYGSTDFAGRLSSILKESGGGCDIIIGGIYGLDASLMKSCHEIISLSPMTMSHQLIRPVLLEQLYRGFSILSGAKYHR